MLRSNNKVTQKSSKIVPLGAPQKSLIINGLGVLRGQLYAVARELV
jgi:hypothetical protein